MIQHETLQGREGKVVLYMMATDTPYKKQGTKRGNPQIAKCYQSGTNCSIVPGYPTWSLWGGRAVDPPPMLELESRFQESKVTTMRPNGKHKQTEYSPPAPLPCRISAHRFW